MNKIYKLIWSKVKNMWVVASELAKSHTKSPNSGIVGFVSLASLESKINTDLSKGFVAGVFPMATLPAVKSFSFTITVAAIVKNEAGNVPTWVQAARSCADEIVVVDTGSTDGTVERFADYGIKCFHYDWHDDFASAKNYMISLCHGDWIVLLDGDEWFREGCDVRKAIAKHHGNPITKAIIADWICLDKDRNNAVMFSGGAVRAFRNQPDVRYFRKVHENLTINYENFAFEPEFKLYHTGYSGLVNRSKHERNLRIMRTMFDFDNGKVEYPTDWRYIEDTYAGLGQFDKALWAADKMISFGVQEYSAAAWITKFNVLFAMKTSLAEMRKQFAYCFKTVPSVSGFRFLASIYFFRNGLVAEGLDNYIEGLRMLLGPQDKVAQEHTYWRMYMPEASALASAVYLQNKQVEAALYACKVCEQYCGQTDWTNRALADVRRVMNQSEESLLGNIAERVLPVLQFGKKAVLATAIASSLTVGMVGVPNPVFAACCNLNGVTTNQTTGNNATVTGGQQNTANCDYSSVSGGRCNTASGDDSSVSGGYCNTASGFDSSVSGGYFNTACGNYSSVSGGRENVASGYASSVFGGCNGFAYACYSTVIGGGIAGNADCFTIALGSVAIGKGAVADENYEIAIGSSDAPVTIGGALTVDGAKAVTDGTNSKTWEEILSDNGIKYVGINPQFEEWTDTNAEALKTKYNVETKEEYDVLVANGLNIHGEGAIGNNSIAIGKNATSGYIDSTYNSVTGSDTIAIGTNAYSKFDNSISVGKDATALGYTDIAIGRQSSAAGGNSVAIGDGTKTTEFAGVAIGYKSEAGYDAIAIGSQAKTTMPEGIAIGMNSTAGSTSVSIGKYAIADTGSLSVAVGSYAEAQGDTSVAVGYLAKTSKDSSGGSTAVGSYAEATGSYASAFGSYAKATANQSLALSEYSEASGSFSSAVGYLAKATGQSALAVGHKTSALAPNSIALGQSASSSGPQAVSLGSSAQSSGTDTIALGTSSTANSINMIAIGKEATATLGQDGLALGTSSTAGSMNMIAIGKCATATSGSDGLALGTSSSADSTNMIAIGKNASATLGSDGLALGTCAVANSVQSIAIGKNASATSGVDNVSIGTNAQTNAGYNVAIGKDASAIGSNLENSVALGSDSIATDNNSLSVGHVAYTKTVHNDTSGEDEEVQVAALTRRIMNVTDGVLDTDVATVGQLNSQRIDYVGVNQKWNQWTDNHADMLKDYYRVNNEEEYNALVEADLNRNGNGASAVNSIAVGLNSSASASDTVSFGTNVHTSSIGAVSVGNHIYNDGAHSVVLGSNTVNDSESGFSVVMGRGVKNIDGPDSVVIGSYSENYSYDNVVIGDTVKAYSGESVVVGKNLELLGDHSEDSILIGRISKINNGHNNIVLGDESTIKDGDFNIAIGTSANINSDTLPTNESIAIGNAAHTSGNTTTAIGYHTEALNHAATALGSCAIANGMYSIAAGNDVKALATDSSAFGVSSIASCQYATALGYCTVAVQESSTALGHCTVSNGTRATAIGYNTIAYSQDAVAIGSSATAGKGDSTDIYSAVAIGKSVNSKANDTVGIGDYVNVNGAYSVAVGTSLTSSGCSAVSIGNSSTHTGDFGIGVGYMTSVTGNNGIALGNSAQAKAYNALAVGSWNTVDGANSGSFGSSGVHGISSYSVGNSNSVSSSVCNSFIMGNNSTIADDISDVFVLGNNVYATNSDTVLLGANSMALENNVVSVGRQEIKDGDSVLVEAINRRIINVGAGINDTDAVNVKQLNDAKTKYFGVNSSDSTGQTNTNVSGAGAIGSDSVAIGKFASACGACSVAIGICSSVTDVLGVALGAYATAGDAGVAIGGDITSGTFANGASVAIGSGARAEGVTSTALNKAQALGRDAIAVGYEAYVSGDYAIGIGNAATVMYTNGIAIGYNSSASEDSISMGNLADANDQAVALGMRSYAQGIGSVALGSQSVASDDYVVSLGSDAVTTGNNQHAEINRRIVHLAAGVNDTDAVNVSQLNDGLYDKANWDASNIGRNLSVADDEYPEGLTDEQKAEFLANNREYNLRSWGQALGAGTVTGGDARLITGDTLHVEVRPAENGTYVKTNNTTGQNLLALDQQLSTVLEGTASQNTAISDLQNEMDSKANVGLDNITDAGKMVVRDLAKESVKVVNGTNTTVTEGTDGNAKTYAVNAVTDGAVADGNTGIVTGGTVYSAIQDMIASSGSSEGKVNVALDNVTEAGHTVIKTDAKSAVNVAGNSDVTVTKTDVDGVDTYNVAVVKTGTVSDGNEGIVTGDTVYDALRAEARPSADGNYIKAGNTAGANLTVLDAQVKTNADAIASVTDGMDGKANASLDNVTSAGQDVIRTLAKGSVKVADGTHTTVTEGTDGDAKTYVVNVSADGLVADGDTGIVTGGAVYNALQTQASDTATALDTKANKDASNVTDAEAWGTKIATGSVAENDVKAVSGDTVYRMKTVLESAVSDGLDGKANVGLDNISTAGEGVVKDLAKGSVNVVGGAYATVDKSDVNGVDTYTVNVDTSGAVTDGDTKLVTGGAVYNALQTQASDMATALDTKANKDASNVTDAEAWGTKIATGSVAENDVRAISGDTAYRMKTALETAMNTGLDSKADNDLSNLTDAGQAVIQQKAISSVKVGDGDNTMVSSVTDADGNIIYKVKANATGTVAANDTGLVDGGTVYEALENTKFEMTGNISGKADKDLGNITDAGKEVVKDLAKDSVSVESGTNAEVVKTDVNGVDTYTVNVAGNGQVSENDTGLVNGGTMYNELRPVDGNYVRKDATTAANLSALDTKIGSVADGTFVRSANTVGQNLNALDEALYDKANWDASNIGRNLPIAESDYPDGLTADQKAEYASMQRDYNLRSWGQALGAGTVTGGDSRLITGDTLHVEVRPANSGTYVRVDKTTGENLLALDEQLSSVVNGSSAQSTAISDLENEMANKANIALDNINADGVNVVRNIAKSAVVVADGPNTTVSSSTDTDGNIMYRVTANATGSVTDGNTGLVDGGMVYTAIENAKGSMGGDIGGLDADGNYIRKANTVAQNLVALDTQVKTNADGLVAEQTARETADTALNNRIGMLTADGNYIAKDSSVSENLSRLDTVVKTAGDTADANAAAITDLKDLSNITAVGETVIKDLAKGSVKVINGTNTTVTEGMDGDVKTFAVNVAPNGAVADGDTGLVSGGTVKSALDALSGSVDAGLADKINVFLDNVTDAGHAVIKSDAKSAVNVIGGQYAMVAKTDVDGVDTYTVNVATDGSVTDGNEKLVTGGTVYDALQDVRGSVDTAMAGKVNTSLNNLDAAGYAVIQSGAKSAVNVVGSNRAAVTKTDVNGVDTYTVDVKADGEILADNKGLVDGGTVFDAVAAVMGNIIDYTDDRFDGKANVGLDNLAVTGHAVIKSDAKSAVNVVGGQYATVAKTDVDGVDTYTVNVATDGSVTDGNEKLVTGGTVYDALQGIRGSVDTAMAGKADTSLDNLDVVGVGRVRDIAKTAVSVVNGAHTTALSETDADGNVTYRVNVDLNGSVASGNNGIVSGGGIYNELRPADGNYVAQSNTTAANLTALDVAVKEAMTKAETAQAAAGGNVVIYDGDDKSAVTLGGTDGTVVHNVADGAVSADSKDVVNGGQLYTVKSAVDTNTAAIAGLDTKIQDHTTAIAGLDTRVQDNATAIAGLDTRVQDNATAIAGLDTRVQDNATAIDTLRTTVTDGLNGKADTDLGNLSDTGKETVRDLAKGSVRVADGLNTTVRTTVDGDASVYHVDVATTGRVESGNAGIVTGDAVYEALRDLELNASDTHYVSVNPSERDDETYTNHGASGADAVAVGAKSYVRGDESVAIGHNNDVSGNETYVIGSDIDATGNNSVVLGKGSDGSLDNVVSVGSAGNERRIVHVADGELSADSKDAVNGKQLYEVREKLQNAEGIDVDKWSDALGAGSVAPDDERLVKGSTVYSAIQSFSGISLSPDGSTLNVGTNNTATVVDFSNSEGKGRVLQGVVTDPGNPNSAANVGYVNAVGQNIINGVNNSLNRMDTRIDKVGAGAAALASLEPMPFDDDQKWSISAAIGTYHGTQAGAVGVFYKPQDNVMLNIRGAVGNGENMGGAGLSIGLNKGSAKGLSKASMAKAMNAQANEIVAQKQLIQNQQAQLDAQKAEIEELKQMVRSVVASKQVDK